MPFPARKLTQIALLINGVFWAWFWIDVSRHVSPYADRPPNFEEVVPVYRFGSKALPSEAERELTSFRSMLWAQGPSFFLIGQATSAFSDRAWDRRIGWLSLGAYVLLGTMLVSFAQWWLVAMAVSRVLTWAGSNHGRAAHRPV